MSLDERRGGAPDDFDFDAAWKAVEPDDVLTLIYTSGTTGPPKGVQITHANEMAAGRSFDQIIQFPDGARVVSYLPMAHIAERSCTQYLPIMFGFTVTDCPDARQVVGYLPEVRPQLVLLGAAHLREAQGGDRGGRRARAGRAEEAGDAVGDRRRHEEGQGRAGRRGGPGRARPGVRQGRRDGALEDPRAARPRRARGAERGRRADAARGDRVLPRDRAAAGRAVGHVGDVRRGLRATGPTTSRSAPSGRRRRASRSSSTRTASC